MRNKKKDVNIVAIGKVWRKKNKKIGGERRMTQEDIVILSQLLDQKFEPVYTRLDLLESDVRELKSGMSEIKQRVASVEQKVTEADIAELETYEDRQMFLAEVGLEESGVARLIKSAYKLLNLETFFTAGEMEVKAWTYHKGWKAPQCAGVIHTDFEKGFIRAEVIKYDDYIQYGSEAAVKEAGKLGVEGKEYIVQDGDIMHFRFNV